MHACVFCFLLLLAVYFEDTIRRSLEGEGWQGNCDRNCRRKPGARASDRRGNKIESLRNCLGCHSKHLFTRCAIRRRGWYCSSFMGTKRPSGWIGFIWRRTRKLLTSAINISDGPGSRCWMTGAGGEELWCFCLRFACRKYTFIQWRKYLLRPCNVNDVCTVRDES